VWLRGLALDVVGALLGLVALGMLPVSVAQPIFCNGLVLLALFAHFYLRERLQWIEWSAVACCFVGTLLLATTLTPLDYSVFERPELQA
jgi:drug/metabolite transporter (DMT)-like permease